MVVWRRLSPTRNSHFSPRHERAGAARRGTKACWDRPGSRHLEYPGARILQTWCKEELRIVIRYEWANGCTPSEIHTKLVAVYGDSVMSVQMVRRWRNMFAEGRVDIFDAARSGCPSTASNAETIAEVNELIQGNRRIKVRDV
ncbi:hypothetical protein Cfor_10270, partial [Coptotermes formosanus]